jgi:hypothetical protein
MAFTPQNFVNGVGPAIPAAWLNELDQLANNALQSATTVPALQAILGIPSGGLTLPISVAEGGLGNVNGIGSVIVGGADSGTANTYVVAITSGAMGSPAALVTGQILAFTAANGNTGASTLNVGGTGVTALIGQLGGALVGGEIASTDITLVRYNGTSWQIIGQGAPFVRTAAEITAGVIPVNYTRPPMDVDRYTINITPGTTDMTSAFNAAVSVALVNGGEVRFGWTSLYLVTSVINCTVSTTANQPGICIRSIGLSSADSGFGILAMHSQTAVFDCTGNDSITFENVSIKTDPNTFPQVGILTARCANTNGSLQIRLYNVRMSGHFGTACYYNYASEDDGLYSCYLANHNTAANTKCAVWTANNISGVTSVVSGGIATGSHSCIDHTVVGCQFYNSSGNSAVTNDCIYLEAVENFHLFGGWAYTAGPVAVPITGSSLAYAVSGVMTVSGSFTGSLAVGQQINGSGVPLGTVITSFGTGTGGTGTYNISSPGSTTWASSGSPVAITAGYAGRALIYVDMSNAPSNFCQIIGLTGEVGAPEQNYGVYFHATSAQTPQNWLIDSCKFPNAGNAIFADSNTTHSGLNVRNIGIQQGYGLDCVGTVEDSRIDMGYTVVIGTSLRNHLIGDTSQFTVTTRSHDSWYETGATNRTFSPNVISGTQGWTAVGAITQRGKMCYTGNMVHFNIVLSGATTIACAANATITMPFTPTDEETATVVDLTTGTSLGNAFLNGSALQFPTAIAATAHTVSIQGMAFVS